jgi:hypothetical protein
MENIPTNQNYRKMLIKSAFETMKSNQREYSKQSAFYLPPPENDKAQKKVTKK